MFLQAAKNPRARKTCAVHPHYNQGKIAMTSKKQATGNRVSCNEPRTLVSEKVRIANYSTLP